jgi:predicted RNase H-like HicB family nuclease
MERTFVASIEKHDKCYIGWVDDVPGAFSQGKTLKEVQENLAEAIQLIMETQSEVKEPAKASKLFKKTIRVQV